MDKNLEKINLPELFEKENSEFKLVKEGALIYVYRNNTKVSKGYHEIYPIKIGGFVAIVGELGAMKKFVMFDGKKFVESKVDAHNFSFNQNIRYFTGKTGALSYLFDFNTGKYVSKGYHDFFLKGNEIWGRTGTFEEKVCDVNPYLMSHKVETILLD